MTAAILANGDFPRKEYPLWLLRNADIVVCCDGAGNLRRLHALGIEPAAVVGDMDSLPAAQLKALGNLAVKVDEQDYNDLNKAFLWLLENHPQVSDIHILGATGKSEAHALGNLSYLMFWEKEHGLSARGISVDMVSDFNTSFAIGDSCELYVGEGRKVSLFSQDATLHIESSGLQWPTGGTVFDFWFRASLNRAVSDIISLRFNHPAPVLVILD
jgi:thiamine pyrophosphokinase